MGRRVDGTDYSVLEVVQYEISDASTPYDRDLRCVVRTVVPLGARRTSNWPRYQEGDFRVRLITSHHYLILVSVKRDENTHQR